MQLTLRVNNGHPVRGALQTRGILSAIINLSFSPEKEPRGRALIHAFSFDGVSEWAAGELGIGDKIEIQVLPHDDADAPTTTRDLANVPSVLFSDPAQARRALAAAHVCKEQLETILQNAGSGEPHHEALKVQRAIAAVVQDLGNYLITPTLRRHPELADEARTLDLTD